MLFINILHCVFVLKCGGDCTRYTTHCIKANPAVCNVVSGQISAVLSGNIED